MPDLTWLHAGLILVAGFAAGMINAIVGSGSLITFPTLLALGYPPLTANISNNVGLVPGGLAGSFGYRRELRTMGRTLRLLMPWSITGGITGALLLLVLPAEAFDAVVPILVLLAVVLVIAQPALQKTIRRRRDRHPVERDEHGWPARLTAFGCAVYGGYFGAAQGVLMMGLLPLLLSADLQRLNGTKNLLTMLVNAIAAAIFLVFALDRISWWVVLLIAVGSTLGGLVGARAGRRMPPTLLRGVIAVVGLTAFVRLLMG